MSKYTVEQISRARERLSAFVKAEAALIMRRSNLNYEESDKAPQTFEELKVMFRKAYMGNPVLVQRSHSFDTVYTHPYVNWAFRFWHDYLHYLHDKDFSLVDEAFIAELHTKAVATEFGKDSLEAKLITADTLGQATYYAIHGKHVNNQLEFVLELINEH